MGDSQPPDLGDQKTNTKQNIIKSGSDELRNDDHTISILLKDSKGLESNEQITEQTEKDQQASISKIPILKQKFTSREGMDILPKKPHKIFPKSKSVLDKLALFENEGNKGRDNSRLHNNKKEYGLKNPDKNDPKQSIEKEVTDLQHIYNNNIESDNKKDNDHAFVHNNNVIQKKSGQKEAIKRDSTSKHDSLIIQNHNIEESQIESLVDQDLPKNIVLGSNSSNEKKSNRNYQKVNSGVAVSKTNFVCPTSKPEQRPLQRTLSVLERKSAFENNVRVPTLRQLSLNLDSKPIQHSGVDNYEVTSLSKVKFISGSETKNKDITVESNPENTKKKEKLKPKIIKEILKTDMNNQEVKDADHLQQNSSKVSVININNMQTVENCQSENKYRVIVEQNGEERNNENNLNKKQGELIARTEVDLNIEHDITSEETNTTNNNETNLYNTETEMKVSVDTPKHKSQEEFDDNLFADIPEKITEFLRKSLQYAETNKHDIEKPAERRKEEKTIKVKDVITNIEEGTLPKREYKPPAINSRRELKRELSVSDRIALFETLISKGASAPAQHKRTPVARP